MPNTFQTGVFNISKRFIKNELLIISTRSPEREPTLFPIDPFLLLTLREREQSIVPFFWIIVLGARFFGDHFPRLVPSITSSGCV